MQEEKIRLLLAMSRFQDVGLLNDTLESSLSSQGALAGHHHGGGQRGGQPQGTVACLGVRQEQLGRVRPALRWRRIRPDAAGFHLSTASPPMSSGTTWRDFFTDNPAPAAERTIRQALERMNLNIRWLELNRPALNSWFGV